MIPDEIRNLPDNPEYESTYSDDEYQDMIDEQGELNYEANKSEK